MLRHTDSNEFPIVSNRSYYSEYQKGLEAQGIQHIDFGKWFREMKGNDQGEQKGMQFITLH